LYVDGVQIVNGDYLSQFADGTIFANHIAAGAITTDKLYAGAVASGKIAYSAVTSGCLASASIIADNIAAGAINTRVLGFDSLASDTEVTSGVGKLWYRYDVDQLRFKGTSGVGYIPRYPLTETTAPPENVVPNQAFEIDRDGDGVPDYWTFEYNLATVTWVSADSVKGGHCIRVVTSAGTNAYGGVVSQMIPVVPGKKYYLSMKGKRTSTTGTEIVGMTVRQKTRTGANASTPEKYNTSPTLTSAWTEYGWTYTADSDTYYVVISPYFNCTSGGTGYFDDITFSEMRALAPTGGTISPTSLVYTNYTHNDNLWHKMMDIVTVSNDTEIYYAFVQFYGITIQLDYDTYAKVSDGTVDYPSSGGFLVPLKNDTSKYAAVLITIPKNCNGKTLSLWTKVATITGTSYNVTVQGWGHSPHSHR
jgi:hypothetical protein